MWWEEWESSSDSSLQQGPEKGDSPGGGRGPSLHRPLDYCRFLAAVKLVGALCSFVPWWETGDCLFVVLLPSGFLTPSLAVGLSSSPTHNFHSYDSRLGDTFQLNRAPLNAFTLKLASLPVKFANKSKKFPYSAFAVLDLGTHE